MDLLQFVMTPARRKKAAAYQEEQRELQGHRVNKHPAVSRFLFGVNGERQALELLAANPQPHLYEQLAESLSLQAKFARAERFSQDATRKAEYHLRALAMRRVGRKGCNCPDFTIQPSRIDAKGERVENVVQFDEIWDGEKLIKLSRCRLCKKVSARV